MKYRKKPVVIEAFQMTKERRLSNIDWPEWLHKAWNKQWPEAGAVSCEDFPTSDGTDRLVISTLEGVHAVGWDDWIIRGVQGELYPCKPDIFEMTYEPEALAEQQAQQPVALTGKQRIYLAQAWAMLDDYALDQRLKGNDSFADGAEASSHEIKMLLTSSQPPAQQEQEARIAKLEAELMRMQGRELKLQFALAEQPAQEPVTWGVDWGKDGDIPCVSIIKRLPDGGIEVMACEYAPYSYTTPQPAQPPTASRKETHDNTNRNRTTG